MVTAGPTQEAIDPVRYITNHSTGKMGYAIAKSNACGADVTLVSGPVALDPVPFVKMVPVTTAQNMFEAVSGGFPEQDILIKAAAVADYRPSNVSDEKVKREMEIWRSLSKEQPIYLVMSESIRSQNRLFADFPWKHKICLKIPEKIKEKTS